MTAMPQNPRFSVREYLHRERAALDKHEYRNGEILLMAGSTVRHALITANVIGEVSISLRGRTCRIYSSDLRIRVPRAVLYTYPDASVVCGDPALDPDDPAGETITNPRMIIEVLSPSTEAYDRGEKFEHYRQLDSLEEYVLVAQDSARVETFFRQAGDEWVIGGSVTPPALTVRLRSIAIDLPLAEVYAGTGLCPPAAS